MTKKIILAVVILLACVSFARAEDYESVNLINSTNWVKWFDDALGYRYDSHGCLHFTPADMYLVYKTIPAGTPIEIKKYKLEEDDPPYLLEKVPFLADKITAEAEIGRQALIFRNYKTGIVVYPSLNVIVIMVNDSPYAKVNALSGPPEEYQMAFDVENGKPVQWDFMLTTPTDPGEYTVLRMTDHYISSAYYQNTIVPFGAWIEPVNGVWSYEENDKWLKLPDNVAADLARPESQRSYNYFDINFDANGKIAAARYAGHDFGKYVMLWTQDGVTHYPEMGYCAGQLLYEQIMLVKDLVYFLTVPGPDDLDSLVASSDNFKFYRSLYELKTTGKTSGSIDPGSLAYYRLYNGLPAEDMDESLIDPRVAKALEEYRQDRLPRDQKARREALGLYNYIRTIDLVIEKQAGWYAQVKNDWENLEHLRIKLRDDFDRMGVLSLDNRQNTVEEWLTDRLEFRSVAPPKEAKYGGELSFAGFFKPDEENQLFTDRERAVMLDQIRQAATGEGTGLNLNVVDALNDYNFGVLLNEIPGRSLQEPRLPARFSPKYRFPLRSPAGRHADESLQIFRSLKRGSGRQDPAACQPGKFFRRPGRYEGPVRRDLRGADRGLSRFRRLDNIPEEGAVRPPDGERGAADQFLPRAGER